MKLIWYQIGNGANLIFNPGVVNASSNFYINREKEDTLGVQDSALVFNGGNAYLTPSNEPSFDITTGTVEAWIKTSNAGSGHRAIFTKETAYGIYLNNNTLSAFDWSGSGDNFAGSSLNDNNWHHIVFTFQPVAAGQSTLYIDGVQQASFNYTALNNNTLALIGASGGGATQHFNGSIDEVKVWNEFKNQAYVTDAFAANKCADGNETNLIAYYNFEDGNSLGEDLAGGDNNATLNGAVHALGKEVFCIGTCEGLLPEVLSVNICTVTAVVDSNVSCYDLYDGGATVTSTVGDAPFAYQWSNGPITPSMTNAGPATYYVIVTDSNNCVATDTITITQPAAIDTSVTNTSPTLTANATGATYQWIDCNNGNAAISGATNAAYTATANGSYAVEVTVGNCTETSSCIPVTVIGVKENSLASQVTIYPNPNNGIFTVNIGGKENNSSLVIMDVVGKTIYQESTTAKKAIITLDNIENGIYFIQITNGNQTITKRIVKQ